MTLSISLPIPPSINHQYATVRGRRILSKTSRSYKANVHSLFLFHCRNFTSMSRDYHAQSFTLTLHFYFRSLLKRDLDGGLKIVQDGICEALGINDNLVTEIHLYKHVDRDSPRVDCELSIEKQT
ncbi:MAG: hypothetical protein NPIRA01_38810 [Nitrospirales bacterium]|nr:MAG: hypothetical protein NPIRA01_38810 [Nitrospirales bacterium]